MKITPSLLTAAANYTYKFGVKKMAKVSEAPLAWVPYLEMLRLKSKLFLNWFNMDNQWYLIEEIEKLDSPALVIFPKRVRANIATAASMVSHVDQLRPHVKTNKSADATRLMLHAGITK